MAPIPSHMPHFVKNFVRVFLTLMFDLLVILLITAVIKHYMLEYKIHLVYPVIFLTLCLIYIATAFKWYTLTNANQSVNGYFNIRKRIKEYLISRILFLTKFFIIVTMFELLRYLV